MFEIVQAHLGHIDAIVALVQEEVQKGIILPRCEDEIAEHIHTYALITTQDSNAQTQLVALAALHIHTKSLGEVRSLMVHPDFRGLGLGKKVVAYLMDRAKILGLQKVLVLTFKDSLFKALGFEVIEKAHVPSEKIWRDCSKCKLFPNQCQEISLIKAI